MSAENTKSFKRPVEHLQSPEKFNPFTPHFNLAPKAAFMAAQQEQLSKTCESKTEILEVYSVAVKALSVCW
jgi:hypothetical protein